MDDLVALELDPAEPQYVKLVAGRLHAHIGAAGVLAVVMAQHADFIIAFAQRLERTVNARRKGREQRARRSVPFLERTQIRTVRIVVGHLLGVHELVEAAPVAHVELIVQVHPLIDHEGLAVGQAIADLGTLFGGKLEIFDGEGGNAASHFGSPVILP